MKSPKQMFVRTFKLSMVAYAFAMCLLYGTTHGAQQMEVSNVVAILCFLIVLLFSFWRALGVEHANHAEWLARAGESIHYPIGSEFADKLASVDRERRSTRINEFV
jgi:hypothetical protein